MLNIYLLIIRLAQNLVALHAGSFRRYTLQGVYFRMSNFNLIVKGDLCQVTSNNVSNMDKAHTMEYFIYVPLYKVWDIQPNTESYSNQLIGSMEK